MAVSISAFASSGGASVIGSAPAPVVPAPLLMQEGLSCPPHLPSPLEQDFLILLPNRLPILEEVAMASSLNRKETRW